jgi:hypothetical protein
MALGKKVVAAKKETVKKDIHPVAVVKGQDFAEKLKKFVTIKEEIKNLTADQKSIEGDIKATALEEYKKMYTNLKRNPESMKVQSETGDKVMFIVMKKYTGAMDEDRATELREKYGETFVEEKSELIMNPELYAKYAEKLEALILGEANDFMTDEEKEELFTNKVTYNIKSDAINEAFTLGNGDVEGLISDINPVLMLKETR